MLKKNNIPLRYNKLLQFFLYAAKCSKEEPLQVLEQPVSDADKRKLFKSARNLWGSALLYIATGKTIVRDGQGYAVVPESEADKRKLLFDFVPVNIEVSGDGIVHYYKQEEKHRLMRFRIIDYSGFKTLLTTATNDLLQALDRTDRGSR